ncbi:hypothetical protein M8J76_000248 [Diaphorina citri]|nr:hypothetical protein M8J76_000248 [Diaphorina citri]
MLPTLTSLDVKHSIETFVLNVKLLRALENQFKSNPLRNQKILQFIFRPLDFGQLDTLWTPRQNEEFLLLGPRKPPCTNWTSYHP